jgi:hypothetical protein
MPNEGQTEQHLAKGQDGEDDGCLLGAREEANGMNK